MSSTKTEKRLKRGIAAIVILAICLAISTFALLWVSVSVDNNLFHTGIIDINLNDGKPVITEDEFIFEPGMTVAKDFFIQNSSTWDAYYKIYFTDVSGSLADVLEIKISDGSQVLFEGTAAQLNREAVTAANDVLATTQRKDMKIYFHYPENCGNETQNRTLRFTMCADAIQTKNNPTKSFN